MDYQKQLGNEKLDRVIKKVKRLNQEITSDPSLGKGFCIGHSYFCGWIDADAGNEIQSGEVFTEKALREAVLYDILPALREYWFDDEDQVLKWEEELRGVFYGE